MQGKHSPGPWHACGDDGRVACQCHLVWSLPMDCVVAKAVAAKDDGITCGEGVTDEAILQANARLIAAAPELLDACKLLDKCVLSGVQSVTYDEIKQIQDAIAKAEGTNNAG